MRRTGERWRAPFGSDPFASRGRLIPEAASPTRTDFQRDRDRIVHSAAFRRLKHKTQVFVHHEGDHYRTRLTHTLEVSQIARALARALGLDEDLAEALALAHDLGHTCFGHTGETRCTPAWPITARFDHNAQALRLVTRLERRYATFDGLNLTWETLEGLVKHNGPLLTRDGRPTPHYEAGGIPVAITEYNAVNDLELSTFAGPRPRWRRSPTTSPTTPTTSTTACGPTCSASTTWRKCRSWTASSTRSGGPIRASSARGWCTSSARRVITRFVEDVIAESERRLSALQPADAAAIRHAAAPVVAFSEAMAAADRDIKTFLFARMYRHPGVMRCAAAPPRSSRTCSPPSGKTRPGCPRNGAPASPVPTIPAPRAGSPTSSPA